MKKILYVTPALAVCLFVGSIGLLFGFGGLAPTAWGYVLCSVAGSVLLCQNRWWGGLVGALSGGIVLWEAVRAAGAGMGTVPIGIGFVVYYLVMALVCGHGRNK